MELAVVLAIVYLFTFILGHFFEKTRIPWIFSALFLGFIFSIFGIFKEVINSDTFTFLASLGMYFLLFVIGFEINLTELIRNAGFYGKATVFIIFTEGLIGSALLHYLFSLSWTISFIVALSFATVGEAVLVPILEEFKLMKKPLGKALIGIGILDDAFELFALVLASIVVSSAVPREKIEIIGTILALSILFLVTYLFSFLKEEGRKFKHPNIETLFVFVFFVFFVFLALGNLADASPLGALFAGIGLRNFLPEKRLKLIESEIKTMSYGFFAPLFFVWVGATTSFEHVIGFAPYVAAIVLLTGTGKIFASWISTKRKLGSRNAFLLGIGLCTRFSTSLVIIKYLFENAIIGEKLYSILVASTAVFTASIPLLFSFLLKKSFRV